jgi:hypothetical protein
MMREHPHGSQHLQPSLNKYSSAGQVLGDVLKKFIPKVTAGNKILDLCIEWVGKCGYLADTPGVTRWLPTLWLLFGTSRRMASRLAKVSW